MLIIVILIGIIYALPNFYGENLALQVTGTYGLSVNKTTLDQVNTILKQNHIANKSITLKDSIILVCFNDSNTQLRAHETLIRELGDKFIVALNLSPVTPSWLTMLGAKPMKLGLDLRGGMHFLMEVDIKSIISKLQEQTVSDLRNMLQEKYIPYVSIRKLGKKNVEVRFSNDITRNKAIRYISQYQHDLILYSKNNNTLEVNLVDARLRQEREYAVQQNITILRNRVNQLGITEPLVQRQGDNYIIVELPGIQDTARAKEILGTTATLEFRLVNPNTTTNSKVPDDSEIKYTRDMHPMMLYKHAILTGDHIINSTYSINEYNQPQVNITLDNKGGALMSNFTKDNIGRLISTLFVEYKDSGKKDTNGRAILVKHEEIINVANIQSRIGNNFRITGLANANEAHQLALFLRSGALRAPMQIIEERIIGPTLGHQNITQGIEACVSSIIASIIFMIAWYRIFGIIATIALIINLVLIVSIMSLLPGVTLTMPGIAGILLILAVAVDANVLINERIKEELKNGRSVQQAIHEGYKGAFSSIIDANITTLITAIILYTMGTGSLKGFAITTIIGVLTSMFTTIIGTRAIVNLLYCGKHINKLSI